MLDAVAGKKFGVIYADCPWSFLVRSDKGKCRSPDKHYSCMSLADIKALPVSDYAADDCVLLFWVTDPFLKIGMEVIESWGFTYKTVGFYWVKTNRDGSPFTGMGYWTRANPEQCLLATRGKPKRSFKDVPRLVTSQRREHSRKPSEMYPLIERLVKGPYLEVFGRTERLGWDAVGNEVGKFNEQLVALDDVGEKYIQGAFSFVGDM